MILSSCFYLRMLNLKSLLFHRRPRFEVGKAAVLFCVLLFLCEFSFPLLVSGPTEVYGCSVYALTHRAKGIAVCTVEFFLRNYPQHIRCQREGICTKVLMLFYKNCFCVFLIFILLVYREHH